MKSRVVFLLLVVPIVTNLFGQTLDAYKYVIVPKRYDFLNEPDKFQINSLTKFLFDKEGFKVLNEDENLPQELIVNPCLALNANVFDNSGVFRTKLNIVLSDCQNNTILTSIEGSSKIKDLKRAHHEALRKAFQSVKSQNYSFNTSLVKTPVPIEMKQDVKQVQKKISSEPVINNIEEVRVEDKVITEAEKETEIEKTKENTEEIEDISFALLEDNTKKILYAQETTNGFQLVDSTPKIIFKAYKSLKNENVYYLENKAGILYKKDDEWYAEYYKDTVMVIEKLNIKF